jgi:hypothetical protein
LHEDGGGDIRHDPQCENRRLVKCAPGKCVDQIKDTIIAAACLLLQFFWYDTRQNNMRPDTVNGDHHKSEKDLTSQFFDAPDIL